jgi:hypothetical protein
MTPYFLRERWLTVDELRDKRADRRLRRLDRFAFACGILALLYLCYALRSLVL